MHYENEARVRHLKELISKMKEAERAGRGYDEFEFKREKDDESDEDKSELKYGGPGGKPHPADLEDMHAPKSHDKDDAVQRAESEDDKSESSDKHEPVEHEKSETAEEETLEEKHLKWLKARRAETDRKE